MWTIGWNIQPGDWVECADGRQGAVISTGILPDGHIVAVEVGFEWYSISDIISWRPGD